MLVVYVVLLFAIPSALTIGGLGSLGKPSLWWGLMLLLWWLLSRMQTRAKDVPQVRQPLVSMLGLVIVAALIAFAAAMMRGQPADQVSPAMTALVRLASWSGVFLVAGVASILFLLKMSPLAVQDNGFGRMIQRLPDAQTLDRIAYRTTIFAFPIFGFGVIFGAIWAEEAWGRYWGWDPKETVSFIAWVVYAAYLHARSTAGWRDRKAAWINVVGFVAMVFNLFFINLVTVGLHSYAGVG